MNATFTQLIDKDSVNNTYAGAMGCACGCKGTYAKTGASVTRRVNEINKAIANGEQVLVYNFTNETKTGDKWGVNIRFTITKLDGYEGEVSISGFGGAYE